MYFNFKQLCSRGLDCPCSGQLFPRGLGIEWLEICSSSFSETKILQLFPSYEDVKSRYRCVCRGCLCRGSHIDFANLLSQHFIVVLLSSGFWAAFTYRMTPPLRRPSTGNRTWGMLGKCSGALPLGYILALGWPLLRFICCVDQEERFLHHAFT